MTDRSGLRAPSTRDRAARPLEVRVESGVLRGRRDGDRVSWRGIPYGRAPTGALRFRAPQPPEPWTGVRDATEYGLVAPQALRGQFRGVGPGVPSGEDCLNLDVTAPAEPQRDALPVMVWIHGGGYSTGSSREGIAQENGFVGSGRVVFVSINHRLNALGYLDFTGYATGERPIENNLGLRDQAAALRWVRDNIAAFGGDPDDVTVFGESAGGNAIVALLTMPSTAGLFARAIAQSPPVNAFYSSDLAALWAAEFLEILREQVGDPAGRSPHAGRSTASALELLTTTPATDLVTASVTLQIRTPSTYPGTFCLAPVVDGDLLPEPPLTAMRAGRAHRVPLILGTNAREGALFRGRLDILPRSPQRMRSVFRQAPVDAWAPMRAAYPGLPARRPAADFAGDFGFWFPSVRMADHQSQFVPVHAYRFDAAPRLLRVAGLDATHGVEVPALFEQAESPLVRAMSILGGGAAFMRAGKRMQQHWLDFATTGTVSDAWPRYTQNERLTLIIDDDEDRVEADPRREKRLIWERFLPAL
ncbi:MAG TPA: carboxylesterase/lipase family protein [Amnibacterium sp.]|nr:carboxylesterase/lipase family protein [Amnibacterium sp.]